MSHSRSAREAEGRDARDPLAHLSAETYDELRRIAERCARGERAARATSLAHEAVLRLAAGVRVRDRAHLLRLSARIMRRQLVDRARRRRALREAADRDALGQDALCEGLDVLALHCALERLARVSPRQSRVVELRFFGGMTSGEVAEALGVSQRTVEGDWIVARAFLRTELERES